MLRRNVPGIFIFRLGLGLWIVAHLVYLAGLFGQLHVPFIWAVVLFGVFLLSVHFSKLRDQIRAFYLKEKDLAGNWIGKTGWVFLFGLSVMALIGALNPPVQKDSLVYHLTLPKLYLESGSWQEIPHNIFSYFPGFIESLYTIGLGLGIRFPAVIHFGFGLACLVVTHELGRILGLKRKIIILCLIALLATPTFWSEMTWAYVDLASSFFWILTVLAFLRWTEEKKTLWLILLGFSMGAAYGCKYTSLILFMIVPLGILFELWHDRTIKIHQVAKSVCTPILIGLLLTSPWWLRNVFLTGNPFFPFFWDLFPTHATEWDAERTNLYNILLARYGGADKNLFDYFFAPFNVFVQARIDNPDFYDGKLGWYYLLAFPVLLFCKSFPGKIYYLLGLVVIYLGYWSMTSQQARYLLVLLPVLSLLGGYFLQLIWGKFSSKEKTGKNVLLLKGGRVVVASIILLAIVMNTWDTTQIFKKEQYLDYLSGRVSKDEYLKNKLNYYPMYEYINNKLSDDSYIFMVMTGNQGFYLERAFFSDSVFEENTFDKIIAEARSAAEVKESLRKRGWTHLLIRPDYFFSVKELDYDQDKQKLLNDLLDNHLRLLVIHGQYWLFTIPFS